MIAVNIDLYPVARELVPPAHAPDDGIGRGIEALVTQVQVFIVVEDLKMRLLGRGRIFVGLVLDKILAPGHGIPGGLIGYAIQLYGGT